MQKSGACSGTSMLLGKERKEKGINTIEKLEGFNLFIDKMEVLDRPLMGGNLHGIKKMHKKVELIEC